MVREIRFHGSDRGRSISGAPGPGVSVSTIHYSQLRSASTVKANRAVNRACDSPVRARIARTSTPCSTCATKPLLARPSAYANACSALSISRFPKTRGYLASRSAGGSCSRGIPDTFGIRRRPSWLRLGGAGSPARASAWTKPSMASRAIATASSYVAAWVTQPGRAGTYTS